MSELEESWAEKFVYDAYSVYDETQEWSLKNCIFTTTSIGNYEIVSSCIQRNSLNVDRKNIGGWTPLMYAVYYDQCDVIALLLKSGASLHVTNNKGQNALMIGARCGHEDLVEYFIKTGSIIEARDKIDWTPVFHAIYGGNINVLHILLNNKANPNAVIRQSGKTPLMLAAYYGYINMVELLLKHGALPNLVSLSEGKTAAMVAEEAGKVHIASLIRQWSMLVSSSPSLMDGPAAIDYRMHKSQINHLPNANSYSRNPTCPIVFDLESLLSHLGLEAYCLLFREQEVDLQIFLTLTDQDLKECGVSKIGPRRKMSSVISRWHNNAPLLCGEEQAYCNKLDVELSQANEKLNEAETKLNEACKRCRVLRSQVSSTLYNMCHFPQQFPEDMTIISAHIEDLFRCLTKSTKENMM